MSVAGPRTLTELTGRATLVMAPVLAFGALSLPGVALLAMVFPAAVLAVAFMRRPCLRFPAWEFSLIALLAISVLWGDDPNYSSERLRTFLPLILAATLATCVVEGRAVLDCLRIAFAVIVGVGIIKIVLIPAARGSADGTEIVLTGGFSKNTFGGLLAIALLLLIGRWRWRNLVLVPVLVVLLALNRSATAWVVTGFLVLATAICYLVTTRRGPRVAAPVLAIAGIAGTAGTAGLALGNIDSAVGALGKDSTLGRRTEIWVACWTQIQREPLLGHGAFTFLNAPSDSPVTRYVWDRFQNYQPPHAHNGLLDLWGQLGLVGVLVFAGMMGHGMSRGVPALLRGSEAARTAFVVMAFILLFGVTEPTYLGPWLVVSVMCIAIAASGNDGHDAERRLHQAPAHRERRSRPLSTAMEGAS